MKKKMNSLLSLICVTAVSVTLFAGCGSKESSNSSTSSPDTKKADTAPVSLSLVSADGGRIVKEDNPVVKEIEKKTNTKLDIQLITASEFKNKYNVMVAGGNIPDITRHTGFDFQQYAAQGIYLDLAPLIEKNAPIIKKYLTKDEMGLGNYMGKQYAIPETNKAGKTVSVIRQDWLDALGIKTPTTLDEYTDALRKIASGDPDKNGKNDTIALGSPGGWGSGIPSDFDHIFGAFGMSPQQYYLKDNKVYPSMVSDEYKAALEYIAKLWSEKLIDPDIFTMKTDQGNQKLASNKVGGFCAWWSIAPQVVMSQLKMKETVPTANWAPFTLKGPNGKSGVRSAGNIAATLCISAKSKNADAALKLLDYLYSDEGYEMSYYGIKGVHYTEPGQPRTAEGEKAYSEKWLDILNMFTGRPDLQFDKWTSNTTDATKKEELKYQKAGYSNNLYTDLFYGIPATDEFNTLNTDLRKYEMQTLIKFITGADPMSKWDEYVSGWKTKGGQKILDSMTKKYNEIKGTNYTSGI